MAGRDVNCFHVFKITANNNNCFLTSNQGAKSGLRALNSVSGNDSRTCLTRLKNCLLPICFSLNLRIWDATLAANP